MNQYDLFNSYKTTKPSSKRKFLSHQRRGFLFIKFCTQDTYFLTLNLAQSMTEIPYSQFQSYDASYYIYCHLYSHNTLRILL